MARENGKKDIIIKLMSLKEKRVEREREREREDGGTEIAKRSQAISIE